MAVPADLPLEGFRSLLEGPSPAVLTTYRMDGSAFTTPVWFRSHGGAFEVVIAEAELRPGDVSEVRASIAARYLGPIDGPRFSSRRASTPGVLLRLPAEDARTWDLAGILPPGDVTTGP